MVDLEYLRRSTLLHWLKEENFKERVEGCMVRVCTPDNHRRAYQMGMVSGVFKYRTAYAVDWVETMQGLLVKQPKAVGGFTTSVIKLDTLSNLEVSTAHLCNRNGQHHWD